MRIRLRDLEDAVISALERAARDYRRDCGPFVQFATKRIHLALAEYHKTADHMRRKGTRTGIRGPYMQPIDPLSFKKGLMML